jgi:transcriptional regulator with XRE-family HTH domain
MPKTLSEVMKGLPAKRRARIEAETAREAAEVMTLRELRKAFQMSQETVAKALNMEQESVSRIERRTDLLLSTMRKYVAAMGGDLTFVAKFPDRSPIQIETLADLSEEPGQARGMKSARKRA